MTLLAILTRLSRIGSFVKFLSTGLRLEIYKHKAKASKLFDHVWSDHE